MFNIHHMGYTLQGSGILAPMPDSFMGIPANEGVMGTSKP